ncbi:hypothetical protein [Antrihabitans sp. YC2-6]|uniref:hypothetical protein n=1 Tax=Antrihabitans sp. YC2-6 TaxID=2799498 RepID=UPI001F3B50CA|nr:hypothetical protein [Antrihabitans sp. YC2-6]
MKTDGAEAARTSENDEPDTSSQSSGSSESSQSDSGDAKSGEKSNEGPTEGTVREPEVDLEEGAVHVDLENIDVSDVKPQDQKDSEDDRERTEEPELDDDAREKAKENAEYLDTKYQPDARESVVLPGTDGTVSGTAIADWLDDDGNITDPETRGDANDDDDKDGTSGEATDDAQDEAADNAENESAVNK